LNPSSTTRDNDQLVRELASLSQSTERQKFLSEHRSLVRPKIVSEIADRVREQVRIDAQQALRLSEAALVIADCLQDQVSLGTALRAKANALYARGENAAAAEHHARAVELFEAAGKPHEVARTLSGSIQPLLLMGEYDRALEAGERARAIFAGEGNIWRLARLKINIGNVYYRQDRFPEALDCYESARHGLAQEDDAEGIAAVLSNMITCYISLNAFPQALAAYQQAREFCEQRGMPLLVIQADYNIAYLHYLRGEYSKAIEMLRATRVHAEKTGDAYHAALCNLDLAELYVELNLSSEAAELARFGYEGFRKLGMGYESAKCLAFSAMAASQQRQFQQSLNLFSQAREVFEREKNQIWPSLIDLYCALVFFNEGRLTEARALCCQALDSFPSLNLWNKVVLAQLLLARIALESKDTDAAFRSATAALERLAGMETPVLSYQAYLLLGNAHSAADDRNHAYAAYQRARGTLETLRGSLRGQELMIAFVKNRLEVYEKLVELCLERTQNAAAAEEAFTYIEQAKSRTLIDLFSRPAPKLSANVDGESKLVRSIRESREELNSCYNLIEREQLNPGQHSAERIANLQQQALHREKELMRMLHEAKQEDAFEAGVQVPSHVSLAAIRAAIPTDTLLVEYFQAGDSVLACVLGPKTLDITAVTQEAKVASLLRLLQFQLSKFRLDPQYLKAFGDALARVTEAHLRQLYEELIAPVAHQLDADHLVFVPHGLLHHVPFHALFDGKGHLIDRHTVSYAPSASIFALSRSRAVNANGPALVLGIPDQQAPAILDEVSQLSAVLDNAEVFVGEEASEQVLRSKGPTSRMIHIATHGRFRQDNPMFSTIRLGSSFLTLFDLYQLKLPVELITLSGCSTGLSVVAAGDELIGLARGLLHAGARCLMLSLWDVHDQSTAEFMKTFYGLLRPGKSKALALRQAMLDLRSSYPHCYHWAPFVLVGNG